MYLIGIMAIEITNADGDTNVVFHLTLKIRLRLGPPSEPPRLPSQSLPSCRSPQVHCAVDRIP
jgi:hypothetical protein